MADNIASDLILSVRRVTRDGGSYAVKCPHCREIIGIDGDDLSEIRGDQYQHKRRSYPAPRGLRYSGCDGWFEIAQTAAFVKEL